MQQPTTYIAYALVLALTPVGVFAETVITNTVSASANSGGNVVTGGEVVEGESSAEVYTSTTINGETHETYERGTSSASVEQTITSDDGEVSLEGSATVETGNSVIQTTTNEASTSEMTSGATTSTEAGATTTSDTSVGIEADANVLTWIAQTFRNAWSYVVTIF